MSVISPEDLVNDVKPWEEGSWRKFIEAYAVLIKTLCKLTEYIKGKGLINIFGEAGF